MGGQSTSHKPKKKFWSFKKARTFVHSLQLKSIGEWEEYIKSNKLPKNIPIRPLSSYRGKGFCGWMDWLGIQRYNHMTLEEFITYCREVLVPKGINTSFKFRQIQSTLPSTIPKTPYVYYGDKWPGWTAAFGRVGECRTRQAGRKKGTMMNYEEAKFYTRKYLVPIGISGTLIWEKRIKEIPPSLPRRPQDHYKEWISTEEFFGIPQFFSVRRDWMPFEEARKWVHDNLSHITTIAQWMDRDHWGIIPPKKLPVYPSMIYKEEGWLNWFDWFNKARKDGKPIEKRLPRPSGKVIGELAKRRQQIEEQKEREQEVQVPQQIEQQQVFIYKGIFSNEVYSDLYTQQYSNLLKFAYKYVKDEGIREDIVSNVLIKIPEAAERVTFESVDHLRRYVYKAVEHRCIDYVRMRDRVIYTDEVDNYNHNNHDNTIQVEDHKTALFDELKKGMEGIAKMRRKVLKLYFFQQKTTGEIAEILDISPQTVLNHKTRGLEQLRKNKALSNLVEFL